MALTKTFSNSVAPGTSVAAAGNLQGSTVATAGAYEASVFLSIATISTAPTAPCVGTVYASSDGANYYIQGSLVGSVAASTTMTAIVPLDDTTIDTYVIFTGNTGSAVTVGAQVGLITGV